MFLRTNMLLNSNEQNKKCIGFIWNRYPYREPIKRQEVLLAHSVSKDPILALKEWRYYKYLYREGFCICSHKSDNLYYIKNRFNGNILSIGPNCIDKVLEPDLKLSSLEKDIVDICLLLNMILVEIKG